MIANTWCRVQDQPLSEPFVRATFIRAFTMEIQIPDIGSTISFYQNSRLSRNFNQLLYSSICCNFTSLSESESNSQMWEDYIDFAFEIIKIQRYKNTQIQIQKDLLSFTRLFISFSASFSLHATLKCFKSTSCGFFFIMRASSARQYRC